MYKIFMETFDEKNYCGVMNALVRVAAIQAMIGILFCSIGVLVTAIVPSVGAFVCFMVRDMINEKNNMEAKRTARRERYYRL